MKVLLVFAHPEPRSLNGALRDVAVRELEAQGHEVRVSDLYAEGWKSEADRADFPALAPKARLKVAGSTGSMPTASPMASASTATRIGATASARAPSPASAPC